MSSKNRVRKYRERLKNDEDKWKEYKEKNRERKRKEYQQKKKLFPEELKRKEREKKRRQAAKKTANQATKISPKLFVTPQSLGKALKRVTSALPKSSPKKVKVVSEIVKSFSPRKRKMVFDDCGVKKKLKKKAERKQRCDALSTEVITKVEEFYQQDGISRMLPGKKDFISVKTNNGRDHRQKRLILCISHAFFMGLLPCLAQVLSLFLSKENQTTFIFV